MSQKPTHFGCVTVNERLLLGGTQAGKGAQLVAPWHIPSNWYPVKMPNAPGGAPTYAQCQMLLNSMTPRFAELVILQSTMLPIVFRSVQAGTAGSSVSLTNIAGSAISGNLASSSGAFYESVPVDVVNSSPNLTFDLMLRLAYQVAKFVDQKLLALYAGFSTTNKGTADTALTQTVVNQAIAEVAGTGEPLFLISSPAVNYAMVTPGAYPAAPTFPSLYVGQFNDLFEGYGAAGSQIARILCSDQVHVAGTTTDNVLVTPSALALVTADVAAANTTTTYQTTSIAEDPETGTPQLSVQLSVTNTGAGNQSIGANLLYVPLTLNAANGVHVLA